MTDRYHGYKYKFSDGDSVAYNCLECGSLVINRKVHDTFHERLDKLTSSLKTTRSMAAQANFVAQRLQNHGN